MNNIINNASKVLIINNLFNLIVNDDVPVKLIQQVYVSTFLLKQVRDDVIIHICDKDVTDYEFLWKPGSDLSVFLKPFIVNTGWDKLDLLSYDIIILHVLDEQLVVEELEKLKKGFPESKVPAIFLITDYNEREIRPLIGNKMDILFDKSVKEYINQHDQEQLSAFKDQIKKDFVGFTREDQEHFHKEILARITLTNELKLSADVRKIIFLDDHKRRFYIGDSYLWLVNIRRYLFEVYPSADVFINCRNENRVYKLNHIFEGSWGNNIHIHHMDWEEIDFTEFDLILYHHDLTIPFLAYVEQNYDTTFREKRIYSFFNTFFRTDVEVPVWNYINLYNSMESPGSLINKILNEKLYAELSVSDEERKFADSWFEKQGIGGDDKVIVFITNASRQEKMLSPENQVLFIESLVLTYNCYILLFDDQHENLAEYVNQNLSSEISRKVIISDLNGLRKDLSLIASSYTMAVIGPCTGLMHLANGIYNYFLNKKILRHRQMPALVVYTGNLRGCMDEYHPKNWWTSTLVKAISGIRVSNGDVSIVPINKLPSKIEEYHNLAVPVNDISIDALTNYLTANFIRLSGTLT